MLLLIDLYRITQFATPNLISWKLMTIPYLPNYINDLQPDQGILTEGEG